jgi:peroxiredoxin (alkyl hydroperoxide reductase subunit C)
LAPPIEETKMAVEVGTEAPDFTLRNENGEEVTLSDLRGQNVVLVFYPFAFSSMCTKELHDVTDLEGKFGDANAQVFGVSVDSPFALKAFREREQLTPHLLSDFEPKGAVAQQYDAYLDGLGFATRATYVIDKDGKVAWKQITSPGEARNQEEAIEALAACPV